MKLNAQGHLKYWLWHLASLLWAEHMFNCAITVNNDANPGRPSTPTTDENIEAVKKIILDNHRITIREVADDVFISLGSCQTIFTAALGMKPAAAKIFSRLLNIKQKQLHMHIA